MASPPQTPPRKQGAQCRSECWFFNIYILCSYEIDLDMDLDFRGASRMTGKNLITNLGSIVKTTN